MMYYYNRDGVFQKESSREYKSKKGAVDKLTKEGVGAVFDENGQLIMSLVNKVGSVPELKQTGTVDAETVAILTGESGQSLEDESSENNIVGKSLQDDEEIILFNIHTTCDVLNVRVLPDAKSSIVREIKEKNPNKKEHPICKVEHGWGKLKEDPEGWIQLAFARVVS